jgi:DNA replication protein DnaC
MNAFCIFFVATIECNIFYACCVFQIRENCKVCMFGSNSESSFVKDVIRSQDLNESQQEAVSSCVSMMNCSHANVKLIWGPPGTGKTKTVACLLFSLLKLQT